MVTWHCQLSGYEFEQTPWDGEGQGSLVCCSPWGRKELDMIEWLNNSNNCLSPHPAWSGTLGIAPAHHMCLMSITCPCPHLLQHCPSYLGLSACDFSLSLPWYICLGAEYMLFALMPPKNQVFGHNRLFINFGG